MEYIHNECEVLALYLSYFVQGDELIITVSVYKSCLDTLCKLNVASVPLH